MVRHGALWTFYSKKNGLHLCKPLILLASPTGFEPVLLP